MNKQAIRFAPQSRWQKHIPGIGLALLLLAGVAGAAPPANDNFANAVNMPGDSGSLNGVQYNTIDATMEAGEPIDVYATSVNTVWFKWTCVTSGNLVVSTTGSLNDQGTEWDSVLGIYTGASVDALTTADPSLPQDTGLDETTIPIAVTAGTTYYIQLAGDGGDPPPLATNILLTWTWAPPPNPVIGTAATLSNGEELLLNYNFEQGTHQDVWTKFVLATVGAGDTELTMKEGDPDGAGGGWSTYPPRIHTSTSGMWGLGGYDYVTTTATTTASAVAPVAGDVVYCKVHLDAPWPDYYGKKTLSLWINPADTSSEAALGAPAVTFDHLPWIVGRMGYVNLRVNGNAVLSDVVVGVDLVNVVAAPALTAHAGSAQTVHPSGPTSATIGGPGGTTASGGTGPYTYSWTSSPAGFTSTDVNPTVSPTVTTTYTVIVTDSVAATASASVVVTYTVLPLVASAGPAHSVSPISPSVGIGGSPTASGGSGAYTYSWSPTPHLSSATVANPTASPTTTTTYTVTVTDSLAATTTSSVVVSYVAPNANLISVDFIQAGGTPCSDDTLLTGTATMVNAAGNIFSGQAGSWNPLDIGTYTTGSASSGFLNNGAGTATTVQLALGSATGLPDPGNWRCGPNEGAPGGADQLRALIAYLYYPGLPTADHFVWAFTGLTPNAHYQLTWFGSGGSSYTHVANSVSAVVDAEGDWNWSDITADGSGAISGTLTTTGNNQTEGLYGTQIEALGMAPTPPPPELLSPGGFRMLGGVPAVAWHTASGFHYRVVYSDNVNTSYGSWLPVINADEGFPEPDGWSSSASTGADMSVTDPGPLPTQRFYRVEVQ